MYVLKQGKAPASVAPSFLSWPFSGQDQWAGATLVRCQLARKELTDPFTGLAMKDGGKKASVLLSHLKPTFHLLENVFIGMRVL